MKTAYYIIDDDPLCYIIVSNIWEDENDLLELDDPLCSLDDASAWLTWENVIDVGASYSSSPCQQHQKIPCAW
jgi:hypothetical protein